MKKNKLKIVFIIILIALFVLLYICIKDIFNTLKSTNKVKTLMTIEKYNYTLNENDSPYYKKLFEELKETLESKKVDEKEYAELLSKLFVTDFYSLKYALSKSDVGGVQFVYTDYQNTFTKKAKDTIYAHIKSNIYGKRKQELPNVKKVEVKSIEKEDFEKGNTTLNGYHVKLKIEYDKDMDYPESVELSLVHNEDKLEIAEMK